MRMFDLTSITADKVSLQHPAFSRETIIMQNVLMPNSHKGLRDT